MLNKEKQREMSEKARLEHEERVKNEEAGRQQKEMKKSKRLILTLSLLFLIILAIAIPTYLYKTSPGKYDNFAKCLKEKGAVMYGAKWCMYTQAQKTMFGKSFKYLDYRDHTTGPNIKVTPTWIIKENRYERVQSFERLSALTGCKMG